SGARGGMQRLERMAHGIAADDAALHHRDFRGAQAALPVLEIDERQDTSIAPRWLGATSREMVDDNRPNQVGKKRAWHRAGCARIEIGHRRDRLFAIERSLDRIATRIDEPAQL